MPAEPVTWTWRPSGAVAATCSRMAATVSLARSWKAGTVSWTVAISVVPSELRSRAARSGRVSAVTRPATEPSSAGSASGPAIQAPRSAR